MQIQNGQPGWSRTLEILYSTSIQTFWLNPNVRTSLLLQIRRLCRRVPEKSVSAVQSHNLASSWLSADFHKVCWGWRLCWFNYQQFTAIWMRHCSFYDCRLKNKKKFIWMWAFFNYFIKTCQSTGHRGYQNAFQPCSLTLWQTWRDDWWTCHMLSLQVQRRDIWIQP